jgi:hypothetical protein
MATRRKDTNRKTAKQVSKVKRTRSPKGKDLRGSEAQKREVAKSKRVGTKRKPAGRKRETKKRAPVKAVVKSAKDAFRKILLVLDPEATKTVSPVEIKF